jgi:hypothetical protein
MNDSSLLDEGQEAGPVFILSESFTKLPTVYTQSKPSYMDREGRMGIIGLPTWTT